MAGKSRRKKKKRKRKRIREKRKSEKRENDRKNQINKPPPGQGELRNFISSIEEEGASAKEGQEGF
jgi:hypothetical protein